MALSSEQIYNSLNGEEVKEIFEIRFSELLSKITQLQTHLTLPRVRMRIRVDAEISGDDSGAAYFNIDHTLTVRTDNSNVKSMSPAEVIELEMEIDALATPTDQVRVEHGLPVIEIRRTPLGIQEDKVVLEGQTHQRRSAAAFTLDRGGPATAGYQPSSSVIKPPLPRESKPNDPLPIPIARILSEFSESILKKGKNEK